MSVQKTTENAAHYVIGLAARTSNELEANPETALIPGLWGTFYQNAIAERIKNRVNPGNVLAIYTDYAEKDFSSIYSIIIGCEVADLDEVPEGLVAHIIPAGDFAVITSEKGLIPEVVPAVWSSIWSLPVDEFPGKLAFSTNFELYDERSADFSQGQIDIYLALE